MEAYASPLNCTQHTYCSAFADTDAAFGSAGSFLAFYPREGSLEVNPPFTEHAMLAAVTHVARLLLHSTGPMSVVVVVPSRRVPLSPALHALVRGCVHTHTYVLSRRTDVAWQDQSPYLRWHHVASAGHHSYVSGLQARHIAVLFMIASHVAAPRGGTDSAGGVSVAGGHGAVCAAEWAGCRGVAIDRGGQARHCGGFYRA